MIQFMRKTGPKNHIDDAIQLTMHNHKRTQQGLALPKPLPKWREIGAQSH
jgi:hypothetical protein